KNAKISFYTGDFEWAQGQLDVLKASTSKLISNDAMQLSLLITDNFNMDTIPLPMMQFARADLLAFQNRYSECFQTLDSITNVFPNHSLTDEIIFLKGKIYRKQNLFTEALNYFETIVNVHFNSVFADDALFAMAEIKDLSLNQRDQAHALYERILTEFPGSLYVVEARKRFRAFTP
ncbi:MAG: tetratricopeptide repeat protein, partial [Bacteroidota bacterium]